MPLYLEGTIKLIAAKNIKGKDSTEDFTYYENYLQYTDKKGQEQVLVINSKEDYRDRKDKMGAATITAYKTKAQVESRNTGKLTDASLYKLSLADFIPNE